MLRTKPIADTTLFPHYTTSFETVGRKCVETNDNHGTAFSVRETGSRVQFKNLRQFHNSIEIRERKLKSPFALRPRA